jgi:acetyl-CoA carboxylase carboxyltransferase component
MAEENQLKARQLDELKARCLRTQAMGGPEAVAKQKGKGKLNARERIDLLLDKGTFTELGLFAQRRNTEYREVNADAVITGYGKINGKKIYLFSQDFSSMGGTLSEIHAAKICRVQDLAVQDGCPIIGINDSGGARIQDGVDALNGYAGIFYRNTYASGIIPQICLILGPCAGGAVYSPALMDFIFMVKGLSHAFITGPRVVKAVTSQEISEEELGGAAAVQNKAGVASRTEKNEMECLAAVKELLDYLPSSYREKPVRVHWGDAADRRDDTLFDLVPANPSKAYDMHRLIERVFDRHPDGKKNYFELFAGFATNIITCFARLDGATVGVIANQPLSKAGCLDIDASDKASRFIRFCDAFNIPLVTLVDVPGYLPGSTQEWGGIIRHGAKLLYAYSEATVPKITLNIRKAYGGAYIGMCSRGLGADVTLAWPGAELAVMGPEGAVSIIFNKEMEKAEHPEEFLQQKVAEYREQFANPYSAAAHLYVDAIIEPTETRQQLVRALDMTRDKMEVRHPRKHGIMPV